MEKLDIELGIDATGDETEQYAEWLRAQGHTVKLGTSTGTYINGVWTSTDEELSELSNKFWNSYCES